MEVVLLNHDYPPYIFGGVGTFMHELAKGLARKGVKVHVITGYNEALGSSGHFGFQRKTEDLIDVQRFPYPNIFVCILSERLPIFSLSLILGVEAYSFCSFLILLLLQAKESKQN